MRSKPTLHRELILALAIVFAGALLVAVVGVIVMLPRLSTPAQAVSYLTVLRVADIAVFAMFGRYLLRRRVLLPLEAMVSGLEAIAEGDVWRRLPPGDTVELDRLARAVNGMAERLLSHKEHLSANVRSLEETNRLLTAARDELIRAEKLASVGRLAAGIAHEIGNPLGAIMGYLGVLGRGADGGHRELCDAAEREAKRIDRIVRGLLDYARPHESRVHPLEVNEAVRGVLELVGTQGVLSDVEVEVDIAEDVPEVLGDRYQLEQVLVNLLLNAVDALDGRPSPALRVTTERRQLKPRVFLPARRKDDPPDVDYSHRRRLHQTPRVPAREILPEGGEVAVIRIEDNGPGIPESLLEQIFEPFVTTKEPGRGTGLGLAVAARLIDVMGGTIRAENGESGGAVFTVLLPSVAAAAGRDTDAADDLPGQRQADVPELHESERPVAVGPNERGT